MNKKLLLLSVASLLTLASCSGISRSTKQPSSSSDPEQSQSSASSESSESKSSEESQPSSEESSESSAESSSSESQPVTGPAIELPEGVTTDVNIGAKFTLVAKNFEGAVQWSSSDTAAATVSANGEVEIFAPGEVSISAAAGNALDVVTFNVTDPEANKSGTCSGTDKIPSEIAVGDSIDLDELITIKNVSHYYLYTESDTIRIEGHKVFALQSGEFSFRIHLGRSKRSIAGVVASEDKINFNKLINSISYNYVGYLPEIGYETWVTEDGFMKQVDTEYDEYENETVYYNGTIYDYEKQSLYDFDVTLAPNYEIQEYEYKDFKVNGGYGRSMEASGIISWPEDMHPSYFAETEVELAISEEETEFFPGFVYMDNSEDQVILDAFYNSMFGGGFDLFSYAPAYGIDAKGVIVIPQYDEENEETYLLVYPVDADGEILPYFTYDQEQFSTLGVIEGINTTVIEPIAKWKENPTYPTPSDPTALANFFDAVSEKKQYTLQGGAYWLKNGQVSATPENMMFMGETFGPFCNFEIDTAANEFGRTVELTAGKDVYIIPEKSGDNYLWDAGAAWIEAVGEGKFYTGQGTRAKDAEDIEWGGLTPTDLAGADITFESLWNPLLVLNPVPAWLATDYDEETEESYSLFDYVSIYDYEETEEAYVYTLNTNGPDDSLEIYSGAGYGGVLGDLLWIGFGFNIGYTLGLYLDMVEWFDDSVYTLSVSKDGKSIDFYLSKYYSATTTYDIFFSMAIADTDPVAPAAAEKIHSVNPDYPLPNQGE